MIILNIIRLNIKIILFAIIFIWCKQSFSQKIFDASYKRFGFIAGTDISNMNFNGGFPMPSVRVESSWKSGVAFGFLLRIPLAKNLYLQPEYRYTQRRGTDKSIGMNYRVDYLSLPVLLTYNLSGRFALVAGPQPELLIQAKAFNSEVDSTITHDVEERSIGVTAGCNFQLYKSLALSSRYFLGLNHVGLGQRSNVKEFKYQAVSLSLEVDF